MRSLAAVVCVALVVVACSPDTAPGESRIEEIRAARTVLGPAIGELGGAVLTLEEQVTRVRLGDPPTPGERLSAVEGIRQEVLADLEGALDDTAQVELEGDDPAVEDARTKWQEARTAAEELLQAAPADLDHTRRLAEVDAALAGIVSGWEVPGSYSEQVERFTNLRNRARSEAAGLEAVEPRPPCSTAIERRREAARWTAGATEELRALVEARRGEEFDARRQELHAQVYGQGGDPATALARGDAADRECWRDEGATPQAADRFEGAVDGIERALNPDAT